MQTFLPYPDFQKSIQCLDYKRLGKQRVEAKQILNALSGTSNSWKNHPAVKMWKGYENALSVYMNVCISEWIWRGYNNSMIMAKVDNYIMPSWFGNETFHASHRSNLLRKDKEYYNQFGWSEPDNLPYVWPIDE